mgnify:CR=1 FL=1
MALKSYNPTSPAQRGLILVEGAVPGVAGGWIQIRDAVKRKLPADVPQPGKFREQGASAPATEAPAPEAPASEENA